MKPSLFLVEGMNIARRSDVTKAIVGRLPPDSFELYTCDDATPIHLFVPMMMDVMEKRKHVIIENGWRADYVYGPTLSWRPRPLPFRRMLNRIALGCNGLIALARGSANLYSEFLSPETMVEAMSVHARWEDLNTFGLKRTIINTFTDISDDIDLLMDKALIYSGSNAGPGIGRWEPENVVLMIGDRHGPSIQPYQTTFNLAFCDMAKAGSSYWLAQQLHDAGIAEERLYWINAYDKEDIPTDPAFIERLKPLAIFALGDSAAKWCSANALQFEHFSHPQYHKRFQHNEPYPLIGRLRGVLQ